MAKVFRALAAVGALLLLLVVGAALALPRLDPQWLRAQLEPALTQALGLPVQIADGPVLRLLPFPQAAIGSVTAGKRGDAAAASVDEAVARIALLPLLSGDLQITALTLQRLVIRGARMPAGSWPETVDVDAERVDVRAPKDGRGPVWPLSWSDEVFRPAAQLRFDGAGRIAAAEPPVEGRFRVSGRIEPSAGSASRQAAIRLSGLDLQGSDVMLAQRRLSELRVQADVVLPTADGRWHLDEVVLDADGLRAQGHADGDDTGRIKGNIRLAPVDLRAWLATHGFGTLPGTAETWRCVAAAGVLARNGTRWRLDNTLVRVDEVSGIGRAVLELAAPGGRRSRIAVALDQADLTPYVVVPAVQPDTPSPPTVAADGCALPARTGRVPPELPDGRAGALVVVHARADEVRLGGLRYGDTALDAVQMPRVLSADLRSAAFYRGQVTARADRILLDGGTPRLRLLAHALGVDLAALLRDLQGSAPVTGTAEFTAELSGGADVAAFQRELAGTVAVRVAEARIAGLGIDSLLSTAGFNADDAAAATTLATLSATATGSGGVFRTDDLAGRSDMLALGGSGTVNVPEASLDLDLTLVPIEPPAGRAPKALAGLRVPVEVSGALQQPKVNVDVNAVLGQAALRLLGGGRKDGAGDDRDNAEALEQGLGTPGLGDAVRGLFNR